MTKQDILKAIEAELRDYDKTIEDGGDPSVEAYAETFFNIVEAGLRANKEAVKKDCWIRTAQIAQQVRMIDRGYSYKDGDRRLDVILTLSNDVWDIIKPIKINNVSRANIELLVSRIKKQVEFIDGGKPVDPLGHRRLDIITNASDEILRVIKTL